LQGTRGEGGGHPHPNPVLPRICHCREKTLPSGEIVCIAPLASIKRFLHRNRRKVYGLRMSMQERNELLAKPASKLKMVECKAILGCKESEWIEIGTIVFILSRKWFC
jgi:hypothetical protein